MKPEHVRTLDQLFSAVIRNRDAGHCVTCGRAWPRMECGHVLSRSGFATRWDPRNAGCQCHACNRLHEENPKPLTDWCIAKHGQQAYDELVALWNKPSELSNEDAEEMIRGFRIQLVGG